MSLDSVLLTLHLLAVVVWVGGMFFAYVMVRPAAVTALEPPQRGALWQGIFERFFVYVWVAVIVLPATGYWMMFERMGGFAGAPLYVHLMQGLGLVMIALFLVLYFRAFPRFRAARAAKDLAAAGARLGDIRRTVGINTILGFVTIVVAALGRAGALG
ncbi:MAG: hypothetical protein FJX65_00060 [Alphaproteobacteria bacterium]|nr:hypothetical protein [Alphaproteobacteria bacterium]